MTVKEVYDAMWQVMSDGCPPDAEVGWDRDRAGLVIDWRGPKDKSAYLVDHRENIDA